MNTNENKSDMNEPRYFDEDHTKVTDFLNSKKKNTPFFRRDTVKWVYFFPLAVINALIFNLIFALLNFLFWSRVGVDGFFSEIWLELFRGGLTSVVFYYTIFLYAPKYQLWISISLGIILVFLIGFIFPQTMSGDDPHVTLSFSLGMIIGAILTIYSEQKKISKIN